ncbi:mucin TcMUCII [Trypanosoma cruzi]|nr:mucin TcMUCII [Trypanosoma cruzi]
MTCRLLYALLVLALCCCPSVCVTTSSGDQVGDSGSTLPQPPGAGVPGPGGAGSPDPKSPDVTSPKPEIPEGENSASQASGPAAGMPGSPHTPIPESIPKQEQAPSSVTASVPGQSQKENAPTTTTTTTTKAPTTTTTTTTEAPTTTTTRAPSLLRESDGSLSSSAWVCAPLLLAVSALAYATLG